MVIVHGDSVFQVPAGISPDYQSANPLLKLLGLMEKAWFAAGRQHYRSGGGQFLFPFDRLELYGPNPPNAHVLDPARQDTKTDFQKQNVKDFQAADARLARGWAVVDGWTGPYLILSYRGGPDSRLAEAASHALGSSIQARVKVGGRASADPLVLPYNPASGRYEVELWGYPGGDLHARIDEKGRDSLAAGRLQIRPDLVPGAFQDFDREGLDNRELTAVAPSHAMHPVLPLAVEVAWGDAAGSVWDDKGGSGYRYEFNMILRGWDHYLGAGISPNPHGGVGFLEFRNLLSNYGRYAGRGELGRKMQPWNLDAFGRKGGEGFEPFLAVDYMDLHVLKPGCGIGLHRHRDNQEVFFMLEGRGLMVVGDWAAFPARERSFEIRTLRAGHLALLKGGNLHGLMNLKDEDCSLFMFGGYD